MHTHIWPARALPAFNGAFYAVPISKMAYRADVTAPIANATYSFPRMLHYGLRSAIFTIACHDSTDVDKAYYDFKTRRASAVDYIRRY